MIVGIWGNKRNVDNLGYVILVYNLLSVVLISIAWLGGPEFIGAFSTTTAYWLCARFRRRRRSPCARYFVAEILLFAFQPVMLNLLQGEQGSIMAKITKGKYPLEPMPTMGGI